MAQYKLLITLVLACLITGLAPAAPDEDTRQRELEQVRERIEKLRGVIDHDMQARDKITSKLRDIERLRGSVHTNLARLRTERQSIMARLAALKAEEKQRNQQLDGERGALSAQLRTAYLTGKQERLKMLLNQGQAASLGRQSVLYRYFVDSRIKQIRRVEEQLAELALLQQQVEAEGRRLEDLEKRRADELASLERAVGKRKMLVADLEKQISVRGTQLSDLQSQEQALIKLLAELQRVLAEFPVESQQAFSSLKGKLAWPVSGKIIGDFGRPRAGEKMKWNGVLVQAERGAHVRAVAHGRVAYADWLPGLGLLTVIEHGDGFLSLYGHNERLDKAAGDWVDAGDVIATVGDSGGQRQPALYFEIRQQRKPVNPHPWFRSKLARR